MSGFVYVAVGLAMVLGPAAIRSVRKAAMQRKAGLGFDSARAKQYMGPFEASMTLREATLILGVRESAGKDKILSAHKRLMLLNHPDNGGSTYIASKVNQAKEVILERI
jgi:DnaJ homolog subfamily C member 19